MDTVAAVKEEHLKNYASIDAQVMRITKEMATYRIDEKFAKFQKQFDKDLQNVSEANF